LKLTELIKLVTVSVETLCRKRAHICKLGVRIFVKTCIIRALPSYAHLWEGGRIDRLEGVFVLILW
jgi:hypothetical protein